MRLIAEFIGIVTLLFGPVTFPSRGASKDRPEVVYEGICDASAAVALNENLFLVADDEVNELRIYRLNEGGAPLGILKLDTFLQVTKPPEADLEAAARIGNRIYWITSHGRNSAGKVSPNRQRFFATDIQTGNDPIAIRPVGLPYRRLLADLQADPQFQSIDFLAAAKLAPKMPGGLNIEGMCRTKEGSLLIGFRNPIPGGKALLIPLINPAAVVEGKTAKFGPPVLLPLAGLGIRGLSFWNEEYIIIAGPFDSGGSSRIYRWRGGDASPQLISKVELAGMNPEGVTFPDANGRERFWIVSDDGTRTLEGIECKKLRDPKLKRFRATWISLPTDLEP